MIVNILQFVKYGLAEDYSPIYKFPAIVGRPKNEAQIGEKINDLEIKVSHRAPVFVYLIYYFYYALHFVYFQFFYLLRTWWQAMMHFNWVLFWTFLVQLKME